jgi:hypothetical protein
MEVARSVKQGSRRGGKAGVRIRDPKQLFFIHSAMEAFAEEQLSLVLLVHLDTLLCGRHDDRSAMRMQQCCEGPAHRDH